MGASLVGYLIIAPKRLTDGQKEDSVKHFRNLRKEAKILIGAEDPDEVPASDTPILSAQFKEWEDWCGATSVWDLADTYGHYTLKNLEEMWNFIEDHKYEETDYTRRDISDSEQVIFAGEMTWGDIPDGLTYRLIQDIHIMGLADILGIR